MKLEHGTPREIEGESMRIIGQELEAMGIVLPAGCEAVVKRAIHTTADFDYARSLRFTPGAVEAGVDALRAGTALVTDTNMALSGVNRGACERLGVERFCYMADPQVAERAGRRTPPGRRRRWTAGRRSIPPGSSLWATPPPRCCGWRSGWRQGKCTQPWSLGHRWALSMWWKVRNRSGPCARTWGPGHRGHGPQGGLHSGGGCMQRPAVSGRRAFGRRNQRLSLR